MTTELTILSEPTTFFMHITLVQLVLLFAAAFAAGAINSVAGGGTLLTFPALLAVLGPGGAIVANGTSTVALVPGSMSAVWGYRGEMGKNRRDLWEMAVPSLFGGALGAYLATHVSSSLFSHLVPWLIFSATFLFLIQNPVRKWIESKKEGPPAPNSGGVGEDKAGEDKTGEDKAGEDRTEGDKTRPFLIRLPQNWGQGGGPAPALLGAGGMLFQFFVAIYGGFFGAGIGILMLAALGFLGQTNIHRMNGLKNFAAVCINGVGALTFIFYRRVDWKLAGLMAVAAIVGGYSGAGLARRIGQANVRRIVIGIGLIFGAYTLYGQLHH
jgi:uncharacterized membrane protein YfcA